MKNYRITVNGVEYEVSVEEIGAEEMTQQAKAPKKASAPKKPAKKERKKTKNEEPSGTA